MIASDAGPLDAIEADVFAPLVIPQVFVDLTNDHLADAAPHHVALDAAHDTIAASSDATAFDHEAGAAVDDADGAHAAHSGAFDNADPADVVATTDGHSDAIDGHRADYNDTPPSDVDVPDPGPPPTDGGGGNPPPEV